MYRGIIADYPPSARLVHPAGFEPAFRCLKGSYPAIELRIQALPCVDNRMGIPVFPERHVSENLAFLETEAKRKDGRLLDSNQWPFGHEPNALPTELKRHAPVLPGIQTGGCSLPELNRLLRG